MHNSDGGPGANGDSAYSIAVGGGGGVYIAGVASAGDFPVTSGAFQTAYHSQQNIGFIAEFDLGSVPTAKETETVLKSSASSVPPGASVTFTVAVNPLSGTTIPNGSITFSIDEKAVSTVALSAKGSATYTTSTPAAGAHYILASYSGSSAFATRGDGLTEFVTPIVPVISPAGGTYTSQQNVSITTATKGSVVYITEDGTVPSIFTAPYTSPIVINRNRTVKAIAISANDAQSAIATAAHTIVGSPSVLAAPASGISTPNATFNAYVDTAGLSGSYLFQYGTNSISLASSTARITLEAPTIRVTAKASVSGLKAKTTYYYRIVATTAGGVCSGATLSFATN